MKYFYLGFIFGFFISFFVPRILAKTEIKFKVGDCLSNGLYYERIVGIRYGSLSKNAIYELIPTIRGHLSAPDTTEAWIINDNYILVNNKNCK